MLFSSYIFIFAFLPLILFGYFFLNHFGYLRSGKLLLLAGSWGFYAWWKPIYLPLLLGSILINYWFAMKIQSYGKSADVRQTKRRFMLTAVCLNVGVLVFYKYMDFFVFNLNVFGGVDFPYLQLALPLAISFFTLQQIAFIVDCYRTKLKERNLIDYALFVSFFPQLIAGPIVHHREMMPQFSIAENRRFHLQKFILGTFVFTMGLFKKVVVADSFQVWVNNGFDHATSLNLLEAWLVHYSYAFQLYFDFSAYTDMAIGLGLMFNIVLPENFRSPYKATSIINFWQRWHMTLTRFMSAYVYKPILRLFPNMTFKAGLAASFLTMVVVGFWHGAAWTFIGFGILHGLAIVVNHLWRKTKISIPPILGWLLTFHFFTFTLVIFRATSWAEALKVYKGMIGLSETAFQLSVASLIGSDWPWFLKLVSSVVERQQWATWMMSAVVALFIAIVYLAPNSMEYRDRFTPDKRTLIAQVFMFVTSIMFMSQVSEFVYFQF
jgi:alginate O-acetyltransferase complex protein AlgI